MRCLRKISLVVRRQPGRRSNLWSPPCATRVLRANGFRSDYVEPWKPESHEQNRVVMDIVANAAAGYAAAGYRTILDGIVIPGWFLEPLCDRLREGGHSIAFAVLRAPLPACTARVQSREGLPPVDLNAIAQIWESFADLGELERHAIDVDGKEPHDAAELIARALGEGRLAV